MTLKGILGPRLSLFLSHPFLLLLLLLLLSLYLFPPLSISLSSLTATR
jgi:hypothetical protein